MLLAVGAYADVAWLQYQDLNGFNTAHSLSPMQVYLPCILQTKKRYVGFAYESPHQARPVFDAKVC